VKVSDQPRTIERARICSKWEGGGCEEAAEFDELCFGDGNYSFGGQAMT